MDKDQYEEERIAALKERRRDVAEYDKRSLEVRYGPGSFGCHEALHVTKLVVDLIEEQLVQHSAVLLDERWYYCVREAQATLYSAYTGIATDHLDAPMPTDDRPRLFLVPKPEGSAE